MGSDGSLDLRRSYKKTLQLFRSDTVIDDDGYDVALPDEGFV